MAIYRWSADWIHRKAEFILNLYSKQDFATEFENLDKEKQAALKVRLQKEVRTNSYDSISQNISN